MGVVTHIVTHQVDISPLLGPNNAHHGFFLAPINSPPLPLLQILLEVGPQFRGAARDRVGADHEHVCLVDQLQGLNGAETAVQVQNKGLSSCVIRWSDIWEAGKALDNHVDEINHGRWTTCFVAVVGFFPNRHPQKMRVITEAHELKAIRIRLARYP